MKLTLQFVLLVIAVLLILCAAAGLGDCGLGSIHIQTGWAGLFFLVVSMLLSK